MTSTAPAVQTCVITGWLPRPAMNVGHRHWAVRHRTVKAEKLTVWAYAHNAGWQRVEGRVRLTVTFVFPVERKRDLDNLHARAKSTIDALKPFFTDDSPEWLELHVNAEVRKGERATELRLEAIG